MTNPTLDDPEVRPRRPAWRQRLVDAEGGLRLGMRTDSTLFAFSFCAIGMVLASLVLGLSRVEWAILLLGLGFALSAELLNQVLKQLAENSTRRVQEALCVGTTAVLAAHLTVAVVSALLLWPHFASLWES